MTVHESSPSKPGSSAHGPDPSSPNRPGPRAVPDDPRLVPFFPLVYVAWADGILTATEVDHVRERLETVLEGDEVRSFLGDWLNPERPPSAESLQALLRAIRAGARDLPPDERRTLSRLGLELARTDRAESGGERWDTAVAEALEGLEAALGVVGREASRELLEGDGTAEGEAEEAVLAPLPAYTSSFEVETLRRVLDGRYADVREQVRALVSEPEFAHAYGQSTAERRDRVWQWIGRLAGEGLGSIGYPEAYGGTGDFGRAIAVFDTLAYHDLSLVVKYGVQFGLFGVSILQLGTERHHRRYLAAAGRAELAGCFAMTETGHGSNVRAIRTTATWDGGAGEFVIRTPTARARKDYIGNAAVHGEMATVFAQLHVGKDHHGVHAFLVPIRDGDGRPMPGVRIEDCGRKEGLNGVDNGRLYFDDVRIPRENLLDRFGSISPDGRYTSPIPGVSRRFYTMLGTLVAGRISIASASVSVAKTGLTIAVRYGDRRRQFGPAGGEEVSILDYRSHQRRLMPLLATTYGLHFATRELVGRYTTADDDERREVEALAAGLKAYASDHAVATLQVGRELCGGQGYLAENRFGRLKADVDVFTTFEGANPVLLQLVAKGLLTGFKEEFSDLRTWGIVRHFAGRALTALAEKNPLVTRLANREHLRGEDFQAAALAYREEQLLHEVAMELRDRIRDGADSFDATNAVQDRLLALARAHVERVIHDAFDAAIADQSDPELARILDRLRDLFVLWRIEEDRGWFLENGYVEARKARAIRDQVNELCEQLRHDARALVDAFGIPDAVLGAPIALP